MREILFRAKTIDDKPKWVEGYYDASYDRVPVMQTKSDTIPISPETLGQFTGLYDKNGKKIFEGDIVIAPFLIPKMTLKLVANMEWNNRWWSFADKLNNYCEIIGNIYDNPELIGETK